MAEVKWIKITTNIFDDEKIKLIDTMPDRDTLLVIWFKLLAIAGKTNDNGLVYVIKEMPTTDEMLATIFNRPLNTVRLALKTFSTFGMIEINNHVNIVNWDKHQNIDGLDKIREQNRKRQAKLREKNKTISIEDKSNVTSRDSNAIDIDIELDKDIDKKNIKKDEIIESINFLMVGNELKNSLIEFYNHRKTIKKPLTKLALTKLMNRLGTEFKSEQELIHSIDKSIENGYTGVFVAKDNFNTNTKNNKKEFKATEYSDDGNSELFEKWGL
ncbi:phage replisome organizer N-terminal domain-containing protein [Cetobacterium sp.]|uniref:phage replisome organizer N-terminal domain-containing protein n=1 Tax=Cetobacterium sp. TaxID=2071632 RepID=UPI003F344264